MKLLNIYFWIVVFISFHFHLPAQYLKSIVYDFDGLDIGATSLPEGDYGSYDLSYQISSNPVSSNDMLGDRVLKINLNWSSGQGCFGRGIARFIEFDPSKDVFNFFFYNPGYNNQNAVLDIMLSEDDNQSNAFESNMDDIWKKNLTLGSTGYWQLIQIPLSDFSDVNAEGNGVMDMGFAQNKGMLLNVEFRFYKPTGAGNAEFFLDMVCFSEGSLPHGATEFDLPSKDPNGYCLLGAYTEEIVGQYHLTAPKFEALFPKVEGKSIRYVNTFLKWAYGGKTIPDMMPGEGAKILIEHGYMPVITWEPMFDGYERLNPVQPRLSNILNGDYDGYIDAFADALKALDDTVIIRFMHEFEGDWYSWSIVHNSQDPSQYINAYRKVVNRFRARGASKVKWMWCVNSDYAPYQNYNWIVNAYPGDNYVDIVATDIYNNHFPVNLPWWRSFRWQATESYYYLSKYIPNKPLFICEVGCRERFSTENSASESKGAWYARMDKELQSNFKKARALIFFNNAPDQNWLVNSSPGALQSLIDNIWYDDYYFKEPSSPIVITEEESQSSAVIYPNPTSGPFSIYYTSAETNDAYEISVFSSNGKLIQTQNIDYATNSFSRNFNLSEFPRGIYFIRISVKNPDKYKKTLKFVRKVTVI
jgi:beta-mannanase